MKHNLLDYFHRYIIFEEEKTQMLPQRGLDKLNIKITNPRPDMQTGFYVSKIIGKHSNGTYLVQLEG